MGERLCRRVPLRHRQFIPFLASSTGRRDGKLEKQYRQVLGRLPVAYRSEPEGSVLYILDNAVSVLSNESEVRAARIRTVCRWAGDVSPSARGLRHM